MSIRAAVVDDERLARNRLRRMLEENGVEVVAEGKNGQEAVDIVDRQVVDILFIDIDMPLMDGLDAAKAITVTTRQPPAIVFCTAYDQYAIEAFETNASAYLLKPISQHDLIRIITMEQPINRMQAMAGVVQPEVIVAGMRESLEQVEVSKVVFFKSINKHVFAHVADRGEILVDFSLKQLQLRFTHSFVRTHRNSLVNKYFIEKLSRDMVGKSHLYLRGVAEPLAVSRRHLAEVKQCFN